jgi:hypothetical protein
MGAAGGGRRKDYVLGWLLAGIANHAELRDAWIFEGGTCLKKCYFETYRFSEALDFSLLPTALFSLEELLRQIKDLARWVHDQSGIELSENASVLEAKRNKQGQPTFCAKLAYRGPLAMPTAPRVLFDLTQHEPELSAIASAPTRAPRRVFVRPHVVRVDLRLRVPLLPEDVLSREQRSGPSTAQTQGRLG